jgi:hypothetical protein
MTARLERECALREGKDFVDRRTGVIFRRLDGPLHACHPRLVNDYVAWKT